MSSASPVLVAHHIVTDAHVQILRRLRNATSGTFSDFNGHISELGQQAWWEIMQGRIHAWLYAAPDDWLIVAYGLVRQNHDDPRWWVSVGVHPHNQGLGYGAFITHDLTDRHEDPIYSAVRRNNTSAVRMHPLSEWEEIGGDRPELLYLRSKAHVTRSIPLLDVPRSGTSR